MDVKQNTNDKHLSIMLSIYYRHLEHLSTNKAKPIVGIQLQDLIIINHKRQQSLRTSPLLQWLIYSLIPLHDPLKWDSYPWKKHKNKTKNIC